MGSALNRLGWRARARFCALVDRLYRRHHRLEEVGGLFFVGRSTWRGPVRRLDDGTEVAPGDPILRLHLNGQLAAADSVGAGSAAAVGLRFARRFRAAGRVLADRLSEDPDWREIVALHAVGWISPYVGEPWGFEFERLPAGLRTRFIRWYMGNLLVAADSPGSRRDRPVPWQMAVWISRRRLIDRFRDEAAPR